MKFHVLTFFDVHSLTSEEQEEPGIQIHIFLKMRVNLPPELEALCILLTDKSNRHIHDGGWSAGWHLWG